MLSHVNEDNQPKMVDVSAKNNTQRKAHARAIITIPSDLYEILHDSELHSKKGPVFATAIIAGVMGAKRTAELIPFCHSLALDDCKISIQAHSPNQLQVDCTVQCTGKTGVEMEALTGASIAALTVYDMCKALSHAICIEKIFLVKKSGGKSDYEHQHS